MIKQLLDEVEQNIVICQWQADQLFAGAEPLSLDKLIHPKFKIDTNSLNVNVHVCNQYCNQFVIILRNLDWDVLLHLVYFNGFLLHINLY